MKNGLPTLGWFKEEWGETELRDALEHCLEYCRECEEERPQRPATSGACEEKEWVRDEEAENAQMSWAAGLTPHNLFAGLVVDFVSGKLETCHLTTLSLRQVFLTIVAHRIHGLGFSSGFDCKMPDDFSQYRDVSRNWLVETKAANMLRGGQDGSVVLFKLCSAIPWVLDNLETILGADCPGVRQQLTAAYEDPTKMVSLRTMEPLTLVNSVNRTQSAVVWKRFRGEGEDAMPQNRGEALGGPPYFEGVLDVAKEMRAARGVGRAHRAMGGGRGTGLCSLTGRGRA